MDDTKKEEDSVFEIIRTEESCFLEEPKRLPVLNICIETDW